MDEFLNLLNRLWPVILTSIIVGLVSLVMFWAIRTTAARSSWISKSDLKKLRIPSLLILVFLSAYISSIIQFGEISEIVNHIFKILFIVLIAVWIIRAISVGRNTLLKQYDLNAEDNYKARKVNTQITVFERIIYVLIFILAAGAILMTFDSIRQLGTSILASAGVAGIIIGFSAQKLLANLLAGFQIAITQPIRLDDVVIMEGEWGKIEEITLTYVVVKIWDQRRLVVPSSQVIDKPFQNWTRQSSDLLGTVFMYVDYRMPVDPIRKELTNILENTNLWDKRVNVVQVTNLTEKAMEIRLLVSSKDSPTGWDLRVHIREKITAFMQKNYPQFLPVMRVELKSDNQGKDNEKKLSK